MAGDTTLTIIGNLTDDPELRFTPNGAAVVKFRVASTARFLDRASGEWKDGDPLFLACTGWRQLAENVAEHPRGGRDERTIRGHRSRPQRAPAGVPGRPAGGVVGRPVHLRPPPAAAPRRHPQTDLHRGRAYLLRPQPGRSLPLRLRLPPIHLGEGGHRCLTYPTSPASAASGSIPSAPGWSAS